MPLVLPAVILLPEPEWFGDSVLIGFCSHVVLSTKSIEFQACQVAKWQFFCPSI